MLKDIRDKDPVVNLKRWQEIRSRQFHAMPKK